MLVYVVFFSLLNKEALMFFCVAAGMIQTLCLLKLTLSFLYFYIQNFYIKEVQCCYSTEKFVILDLHHQTLQ